MTLPFSLSRLTWVQHNHFADFESRPSRERRLTWKDDDDKKYTFPRIFHGEDDLTPEEKFLKDELEIEKLTKAPDTKDVLHMLEVTGKDLKRVISGKNKDTFVHAVWSATNHSKSQAKSILQMFKDEKSPEEIQSALLAILVPVLQKETQKKIEGIIKQDAEETDTQETVVETKKRKKSAIEKLLEGVSPMYGYFAQFRRNRVTHSLGIPSLGEIADDLKDPSKRVDLLEDLASMRHDLFFQGKENLEERIQALEDLSGFLDLAQYLLSPDERIAFQDSLIRVKTNAHALRQYAEEIQMREKGTKEVPIEDEYQKKFQNLKNVSKDISAKRESEGLGWARKKPKEAKKHLIQSLRKSGEMELAQGLDGGWIDELHPSDELKYTCTLIALEELGYLYSQIATGIMTTAPSPESIKEIVLEAFRRGVSGRRQRGIVPFKIEDIDPEKDFEDLKKIVETKEHPTNEEIDELILLAMWIEKHGGKSPLTTENIRIYREKEELTREELEKKAENSLEEIGGLAQSSIICNAIRDRLGKEELSAKDIEKKLRSGDLTVLVGALAGVLQEDEIRATKPDREPETLHEEADSEYVKRRTRILGQKEEIAKLDAEYEKERAWRHDIHELRLTEWKNRLIDAIESLIQLRAAELEEQYSSPLYEKIKKRAAKYEKEQGETTENRWVALQKVLKWYEAENVNALNILKHADLREGGNELRNAEEYVAQLRSIEEAIQNAESEAREYEEKRKEAQDAATAILKYEPVSKRLSTEQRVILEEQADPDSDPDSPAIISLRFFEDNPHLLLLANEEEGILQKIEELLENIEAKEVSEVDAEEFTRQTGLKESALGGFVRKEEKIVLNREKIAQAAEKYNISYEEMKEIVLTEEFTHARNYALQKHLGSALFLCIFEIASETDGFQKQAEKWVPKGSMSEEEWQLEVADELLAKQAIYKRYKDSETGVIQDAVPLNAVERSLLKKLPDFKVPISKVRQMEMLLPPVDFQRLAAAQEGEEEKGDLYKMSIEELKIKLKEALEEGGEDTVDVDSDEYDQKKKLVEKIEEVHARNSQEKIEEPFEPTEKDDEVKDYVEGSMAARDIRDCENSLVRIKAFLDLPSAKAMPTYADNMKYTEELEKKFEEAHKRYKENSYAESTPEIVKKIADVKQELGEVTKKISEYDAQEGDLRGAPRSAGFLRGIWDNIEFMSIYDFVEIFKAIGEDVKRQHQRRQQGRIGRVGESLTSWIAKVPVIGKFPYLSTLSAEFHRRDKQAEIDEVDNWKKAFEDVDSYELQEMLGRPANKDQMKAILNMLSERGRIDWSDTKFWDALNRFSVFSMPIEECQRNENLREVWLRKLITDIYRDKDHYRKWKTANDSAITSKKKEFTPEVDRLSNLGDMAGELAKQLKIFTEAKNKGQSIPDDVQPHLYEEIIDYAIRLGKMSMEEKFYYLVQGTAVGLISLDRLRTLAGEEGDILQIFPFIDYFYQKNDTKPEIDALAARLWESSSPYKPGLKTTLWLELEVAREQSVQERLRKGIDRRAGDMDHDDMHFFIPRLDFEAISSMALPVGGGKQKTTTDGWRNAYLGYNSFFKSLGILARLEEDKEDAKFTSEDAYQVAKAIAGYVRMDGILTRRATFGDQKGRRPSIPWGEMKNSYAVLSDGKTTVYEYRKKVDEFVRELLGKYNYQAIDDLLYSTEENPTPDKKTQDLAEKHSDALESKLLAAIKKQGTEKMKGVLKEYIGKFKDMGQITKNDIDFSYENARRIWQEGAGREQTTAS